MTETIKDKQWVALDRRPRAGRQTPSYGIVTTALEKWLRNAGEVSSDFSEDAMLALVSCILRLALSVACSRRHLICENALLRTELGILKCRNGERMVMTDPSTGSSSLLSTRPYGSGIYPGCTTTTTGGPHDGYIYPIARPQSIASLPATAGRIGFGCRLARQDRHFE